MIIFIVLLYIMTNDIHLRLCTVEQILGIKTNVCNVQKKNNKKKRILSVSKSKQQNNNRRNFTATQSVPTLSNMHAQNTKKGIFTVSKSKQPQNNTNKAHTNKIHKRNLMKTLNLHKLILNKSRLQPSTTRNAIRGTRYNKGGTGSI